MPILTELKKLYVKMGGEYSDVDKYENITDVLNAISLLLDGKGDACNAVEAIANITKVIKKQTSDI